MTEAIHVSPALNSLFKKVSQNFNPTEAEDAIRELKRLCPTVKDFDQTDLNGAFKKVYKQGAIDDGNPKLMAMLSKKASKKDEILDLISDYEKTLPQKRVLVGRDADVSNIIKFVTDPRVPRINLFGESGVGKTTLAKEVVSMKIKKDFEHRLFIDLRGTKDTNAVYFKVLEEFKLTAWDYSNKRIYKVLLSLTTKTLLILDNVEQFLSNEKEVDQKRRGEFLEFLRTMMSSEASKRGCLKVILTSRMQIGDSLLEKIDFVEYKLLSLTEKHSKQLMSRRLIEDDQTDEKQEKALIEIADLCRNTPYLLERAEQLLRQNFSKPSEVLEKLNSLKHKGVPERFACISELFDSLPNDEIRQVAVKISLLQRPFSVSTAMTITDISSDYDAELDLEMLVISKIITAEDVEVAQDQTKRKRKYDLHALFREYVTFHLCKEYPAYKQAYGKAEHQFVEHFSNIFRQHAGNLDKDFVGTYKELQEDKANLELSIDLVTRKEAFDLILQSEDVKETASVALLFEAFKSIKERRKLFGEWAKIVEKKEKWLSSTIFRCWESIQLSDMEGTQNASEALKRAEMSLAKAKLLLPPEQTQAAKGLCNFSGYDCFGLCVMSHGADDCFYGSDGIGMPIKWSTVLALFRKKPTLKGKPKLFLFQACRIHNRGGERQRRGEHPTGSEYPTRSPTGISSSRITYLPSDVQDTLVVHSCFQGHESFHSAQDGTFFTQSLVRELRENVNNEDMLSMVTKVTKELATQLGNKQVPEMHSTLTKKLYLNQK